MKAEQALDVVIALGLSVHERERLANMLVDRPTVQRSPIREMLRKKKTAYPK